jgi:hypothetical protein
MNHYSNYRKVLDELLIQTSDIRFSLDFIRYQSGRLVIQGIRQKPDIVDLDDGPLIVIDDDEILYSYITCN